MIENAMFIWLADSCYPRQGPQLEKGKVHRAAEYPVGIVETWIAQSAAKWADGAKKTKVKEA